MSQDDFNGSRQNDDQDPWKKREKKASGPPDLDEMFAKMYRNLSKQINQKKGSQRTGGGGDVPALEKLFSLKFFIVLLLVFWVLAGIFIVSPAERAVVLRLGKYQSTVGPGPHWIPRVISSRSVVNVQRIGAFSYNAEMLTQDENIVFVSVSVQYRIDNARDFLFSVVSPVASLQQATASALRQVVGHTTLDEILTTGRTLVRDQVAGQINAILEPYKTGILVTDVNLQPAKPPEEVTEAFDDAIKAREDEQRYINQAEAYAEKVVPIAQGQATRLLKEANAYKEQVILQSEADTARYLALLPEYQRAPGVTKERMYLQAMESVLSKTSKVLVDTKDGHNIMYLPLGKMLTQSILPNTPADSEFAEGSSTETKPNAAKEVEETNADMPGHFTVNRFSERHSYSR